MNTLKLGKGRHRSDSITDIINRFHKIREDRAKLTANSFQFLQQSLAVPKADKRPSSAKRQSDLEKIENARNRRKSVPYLYRPMDHQTLSASPRQDQPLYKDYRRHSISHAVYEYELAKAHLKNRRVSVSPVIKKPKVKQNNEVEDLPKWLVGTDLHQFYSLWDRPEYKQHRKKLAKLNVNRPLPLPFEMKGDSEDTDRPRLSSF